MVRKTAFSDCKTPFSDYKTPFSDWENAVLLPLFKGLACTLLSEVLSLERTSLTSQQAEVELP